MIKLQPHKLGVVIPVKAFPGSRENSVRGEVAGSLKVAVTQIAEKGKANPQILKVLATFLNMRTSKLEILSGETSRQKNVLVLGASVSEIELKLQSLNNA